MLASLVGLAAMAGTLVPTDAWTPPVGGIVNATYTAGFELATVADLGVMEASAVAPGEALATADGLLTLTAESITVAAGVVTFDYSLVVANLTTASAGNVEVFLACVSATGQTRNSTSLSWTWAPGTFWPLVEGTSGAVRGTVDFTPTANCGFGAKRQIVALADMGAATLAGEDPAIAVGWANPTGAYPLNPEPGYAPNTFRFYMCASGTACQYRLVTVGTVGTTAWTYGSTTGMWFYYKSSALMGTGSCTSRPLYFQGVSVDGLVHPSGQSMNLLACTGGALSNGYGVTMTTGGGMGYWWVSGGSTYTSTPYVRYYPPGSPLRSSGYLGHRSLATLVSFDALDGLLYVPSGNAGNIASVEGLCTGNYLACLTRCADSILSPSFVKCLMQPTVKMAEVSGAIFADLRDSRSIGRAMELSNLFAGSLGGFAAVAGGACGVFATIPLGEYGGDVALSSCSVPTTAVVMVRIVTAVMVTWAALMFATYLVLSPLGLWPKRLDDSK